MFTIDFTLIWHVAEAEKIERVEKMWERTAHSIFLIFVVHEKYISFSIQSYSFSSAINLETSTIIYFYNIL